MALALPTSDLTPPETREKARDSLNLVEFPLAVLADRVPTDLKVLEFQDEIRDPSSGKMVTRRLVVDASQQYGLPTATDDEVLLGLIQLTKRFNDFRGRKVHFSRYELIRLLRWPLNGKSYARLEESLNRWMGVTLDYKKAWWDATQKSWVDVKFHVLDQIHLYESDAGKVTQPTFAFSWFEWNEVVFRSFADGYLKRLNLDLYLRLQLPIARRVYRFLDKRFYRAATAEFDLTTFAFEHVGLSRKYHTGKIKEKLAPALAELEAAGFLEPTPEGERYRSLRRGKWTVKFVRRGETPIPTTVPLPLVQALTERGVAAKAAAALVAAHPADRVARQIDVFDWMRSQVGKELQNPGGWLVAAIEADFTPPSAYVPKGERERKARVADETKQKQAEKARAEREQMLAEKAERDRARRFLADLDRDPARKKAFEERAVENADPKMQEIIRQGGQFSNFALQAALMSEAVRETAIA